MTITPNEMQLIYDVSHAVLRVSDWLVTAESNRLGIPPPQVPLGELLGGAELHDIENGMRER